MPTPSDPTPVPEKSYDQMAKAAQARLDDEQRQVSECVAGVKHGHELSIPHDTGSSYERETNDLGILRSRMSNPLAYSAGLDSVSAFPRG